MAKVAAEAAGRQAASFVLGCVAALTLVLLLQRRPEELTRPRAPVQFFGSRSLSSPSGRGGGGTSPSSPPSAPAGPAAIVAAADGQLQTAVPVQANATKLMKPAAAGATTTAATADDLGRVPATPAHRQQEVGWFTDGFPVQLPSEICCSSIFFPFLASTEFARSACFIEDR
jgi:hypothetical protein